MNIDEKLIPHIEKALGFKLYKKQIKVLINDDWSDFIPGRRQQGRTTAHMIRLALSKNKLHIDKFNHYTDGFHGPSYIGWYRYEFMELRDRLKRNGFKVVDVISLNDKNL